MTFLWLWSSPGGGGAQLVSSGGSTVWTEKTPAEDTPRREYPHDVVGLQRIRALCGCRMIVCL